MFDMLLSDDLMALNWPLKKRYFCRLFFIAFLVSFCDCNRKIYCNGYTMKSFIFVTRLYVQISYRRLSMAGFDREICLTYKIISSLLIKFSPHTQVKDRTFNYSLTSKNCHIWPCPGN